MDEEDEEDQLAATAIVQGALLPDRYAQQPHLQLHQRHRSTLIKLSGHLLLLALILLISDGATNCDASRHLRRRHRHLQQQREQPPAPPAASPLPAEPPPPPAPHLPAIPQELYLEHKVAALASKLEQVLVCHRLAAIEAAALAAAASVSTSNNISPSAETTTSLGQTCPAHFDGHLCWPSAAPGETIRLACPRLQWPLPGQPQQQQQQQQQPQQQPLLSEESAEALKSVMSIAAITAAVNNEQVPTTNNASTSITWTNGGLSSGEEDPKRFMSEMSESDTTMNDMLETTSWFGQMADYSQCANQSFTSTSLSSSSLSSSSPLALSTSTEEEHHFDPTDNWIKLDQEEDQQLVSRLTDELYRIEGNIDPYADPDLLEQWTLCIRNIMLQNSQQQQQQMSRRQLVTVDEQSTDLRCPIIFDGWRCWPSTKAGETAYVSCPSNHPGFSAERKAHKICTDNGTWYKHPETNRVWSNYTTCVDTADLAFRTKILNLYIIGNLISLVALTASLIVFISFKSLKCTRVTIHKNLFLSFITNNLMWIIWYTYVVNDASLLRSNPWGCQLWHILLHYFLVSNYFWMFCEGLYLHTLLVVAFVSEDKILKWFYILGWLTPVPLVVAYAYNRSYDGYYTNFCWMEESPYNLILMAPIGMSLLLNLVFLINIVRVLVTKLRANNSPDAHQTRKAVRATLILIPLLGLHYILTPFRPETKSEWEGIYETVAAVCTSFQGLCVAMLFCFCNGEVTTVLTKRLKLTFDLRRNNHQTQFRSRSNTYNQHSLTAGAHLSPAQLQQQQQQQQLQSPGVHLFQSQQQQPNGGITNLSLRSVISSASDELIQQQQQSLITPNSAPQKGAADLVDVSSAANSNSNSNNSRSGSLITTVTASPINSNIVVAMTAVPQPTKTASGTSINKRGLDNDLQQPLLSTREEQQQRQLSNKLNNKLDVGEESVKLLQSETMAVDFATPLEESITTTSFSAV